MERRENELVIHTPEALGRPATRRGFLQMLGVGGTLVLLPGVFACDGTSTAPPMDDDDGTVRLKLDNDVGILNYAYALEQLEAAFYIAVVDRFAAAGIGDAAERSILTDIRDHEVIHREFLRQALGSAAIPQLQVDFGSALDSRQNILTTARTFEDLGVSAYNGAGKYLQDARNLLVAGKIVSVEARHASVIRDLLDTSGRAFAGDDVVNEQGLDVVREPSQVLPLADPFITTSITISAQPTA